MTDTTALNSMLPLSSPTSTSTRPRLANSNVHTIEITNKFRDAASKLRPGTLVKDEYFTLFESVGALEIGDPKMDSGCADEEDSLEITYDVCRPLSASELIWLMDELLSREVAWQMGYPLSQTLFTSVYVEQLLWPDPTQLRDAQFTKTADLQAADPMLHKLFRSYCLGLIKCCDLVLGMVTSQHYYEEEDFATQLYNRELLHRFSVADILSEMQDAISYLKGTTLGSLEMESIDARMRFRHDLLIMLSSHVKTSDLSSTSIAILNRSLLPNIQSSRYLGTPVPDSFTLKIQRKLASTVPPRPMVTIDEGRTFDYLNRFVRDCEDVFSVLCVSHSQDLLASYSLFNAQTKQPSVYVRALMQSWLNVENAVGGVASEQDFIVRDMASITLAASPLVHSLQSDPRHLKPGMTIVKQHVSDFIIKHGRSFLNLWRTACLNRCRVRRTLCHAALEWDQIQAEAEELDDELQRLIKEPAITYPVGGVPTFSYSLSSWVYHYKLIQLRSIMQMGFELEIYAPHELSGMYWYLAHLCDTHLAHLERISFFVSQRSDQKETEEHQACLKNLYRQFSWLKATEATARALHGLYTVLQRHGQMQQPAVTYASDGLRYELRMKPFLYLSVPEPLSFQQYQRLNMVKVRNDLEVLDEAVVHLATAKKGWDEVLRAKWNAFPLKQGSNEISARIIDDLWHADVRGAIKTTIGTNIAVAALKKQLQKMVPGQALAITATVPRTGDKDCWHPWWLVPKVKF